MKKCINFLMSFSIIVTCTHFWSCTHSPSDTLNESPFSSILSPANNTIFVAGDSISISMDVKDDDGRVVEVRLFMDSVKVCSLNEPYFYMLDTDNFSIGKHVLKIEAEDNDNSVSSDSIVIEMAPITFGSYFIDCGQSISSTQDGGYIIAGYTEVYFSSINQLLVKTDKNGSEEWTKIFGDSSSGGMANSVIQNVDGAYIITGSGYTKGVDGYDVSLIKTNYAGNEVWSKTFGGSGGDHGMAVSQTSDGGYIITGYTDSFGAGKKDVWLIKTDAMGNEEWNRTYGGQSHDYGYSVALSTGGGYALTGSTSSYGAGAQDMFLIITDNNGNLK